MKFPWRANLKNRAFERLYMYKLTIFAINLDLNPFLALCEARRKRDTVRFENHRLDNKSIGPRTL